MHQVKARMWLCHVAGLAAVIGVLALIEGRVA
jgi:hypothetical protein